MPRVSVKSLETAEPPAGAGGLEYFSGEAQPIHLTLHRLAAGDRLAVRGGTAARLAYVWSGRVEAAGRDLAAGSVVIVEPDAASEVVGQEAQSEVLVFGGTEVTAQTPGGGQVHILPRDQAPTVSSLGASGVSGTLFADGGCPSCGVWLHENRFPAQSGPPANPQAGVHSHDENEIIFVTAGQMRLGNKLVGPGTALAIAAGTMYSFLPGPEGLTFVNFRAGRPGLIHFADGRDMDEVAVWSRVDRPLEYLAPA
jgi:hypothetical protein